MKLFLSHQDKEARAHAAAGGQALRLQAPHGSQLTEAGLLYDQCLERLVSTTRAFGFNAVVVYFTGTERQFVFLDGPALQCAKGEATVGGLPAEAFAKIGGAS